jgi:spiro-SPASM protein
MRPLQKDAVRILVRNVPPDPVCRTESALTPHSKNADIFYIMRALTVIFGGALSPQAFEPVFAGKSAFSLALEGARSFPGTEKLLLLGNEGEAYPGLPDGVSVLFKPEWTGKGLLKALSEESAGFDLTYFAWGDCPFLDPVLTGKIADRHLRFAAEYSYADGWPYGFAPELLSPGTAGILLKIAGDEDGRVERDTLFAVLQKDINAFDIETEISPVDLRYHRLSLTADSKRNLLLLTRFFQAEKTGGGIPASTGIEDFIAEKSGLLRTLPNFYTIQVSGPCAKTCELCPYPRFGGQGASILDRKDFLAPSGFGKLLDKIETFSGDAVIDLSLWGELSLHPQREELVSLVLARSNLSLIIETAGLGWDTGTLEVLAEAAGQAAKRKNRMAPLSWIVSLDPPASPDTPGIGAAAVECVKKLTRLFPKDAYVQAVRTQGAEDGIEQFYRSWKKAAANIIIQKYDNFCGYLPDKRAVDLSPIKRQPCWHLMRDMAVLIDGTVPVCREDITGSLGNLGNAFTEPLETLWSRGEEYYHEHCGLSYRGICADCDEYYTYNF